VVYGVVVFFFSSRRRHTRCLSDWSSDVCSSDLMMSRESLKERRCLILVEEMTHYAEIFTSIVAEASDKTLDLAASGPTHRRGRLGYGPSVNVRKDNCDPLLPAISKLRDTLKHIRSEERRLG